MLPDSSKEDELKSNIFGEEAGVDDWISIESIEVILSKCGDISSLSKCQKLRSLTLIYSTQFDFEWINHINTCSATLQLLNLSQQGILSFTGLKLPCLRCLILHDNRIETMVGLDGVPHLRKLCLSRNCIKKMEHLHYLVSLRELDLQGNRIDRIEGLRSLISLRSLLLAGNKIDSFQEIVKLKTSKSLREISLLNIHFGPCPITFHNDYPGVVICDFEYIQILDGKKISVEARNGFRQRYLELKDKFYNKIDSIEKNAAQKLAALEEEHYQMKNITGEIETKVKAALARVDTVIRNGIKEVDSVHKNMLDKRIDGLFHLKKSIQESLSSLDLQVDELIQNDKEESKSNLISLLTAEALLWAKKKQALEISRFRQIEGNMSIWGQNNVESWYQLLNEESVEFQCVSEMLKIEQYHEQNESKPIPNLSVLQCYLCTLQVSPKDHDQCFSDERVCDQSWKDNMYVCGTFDSIDTKVKKGKNIILYSDPLFAVQSFLNEERNVDDNDDDNKHFMSDFKSDLEIDVEEMNPLETYVPSCFTIFQCRVLIDRNCSKVKTRSSLSFEEINIFDENEKNAKSRESLLVSYYAGKHSTYSDDPSPQKKYAYIMRDTFDLFQKVRPYHYILVMESKNMSTINNIDQMEKLTEASTTHDDAEKLFQRVQISIEEQFKSFEDSLCDMNSNIASDTKIIGEEMT